MNFIKKIRQDKDSKELSFNIIITLLIKGAALIISLLIVPTYRKYFGSEDVYGAWITISSIFTWITMFDLGIGNGLRNHLVKSMSEKNDDLSKRYISSAYLSVGIISVVIYIVGSAIIYLADWNSLLKIEESIISNQTFHLFIWVLFTGVVVHFFLLLVSSICYAIQKTFLPNVFTLATSIIVLIYLTIISPGTMENKVMGLATAYLFAYNIPVLLITIYLFSKKLRNIKPSIKYFDKSATRKIISLGGWFLAIQIALIALSSSNEIYITYFFDSASVSQYNYYNKLYYLILVFVFLISQPVWSAVTKAYVEKRYKWIKTVWKLLWGVCGVCALGCVVLSVIYKPVADIWIGQNTVDYKYIYVICFSVYIIVSTVVGLTNCLANAFGLLKWQAILTIAGAVIKIPISFVICNYINNWSAIVISTVISMIPLMVGEIIIVNKKICRITSEVS